MASIGELTAKLGLDNSDFVKGMQGSFKELTNFGKGMSQLSSKLGLSAKSFTTLTGATNLFKVALAGTGIGAIVIALGSLVAYLTTTQQGMDKLRMVLEPVSQIFQRLLGVLQDLGGNVFKGIAQMLNGDLKEGFKTLANGAKEAGSATVGAFKDGISAGTELAKLHIQIEEAQNDLILTTSRLNREIQEQKEISSDQTRTERERQTAAARAIELINQRVKAEDNVLALQEKKLRLEQKANDTSRAGFRELNELIAQREDLEARAASERRRLNSIAKKDLGEEIKMTVDLVALQREQLSLFLQMTKGAGIETRRDPFAMESTAKFSKETLQNVKKLSDTLVGTQLKGVGILISEEDSARANKAAAENIANLTQMRRELDMVNSLGMALGQTLTQSFEAMLIQGKITFSGLIQGLKAMLARLIAAAAAAFVLNKLLGGLPGFAAIGGGGKGGFKELFSMLTGLPKFAKGGMVTGLTTAVLGDNPSGKEAVIPFERMGEFLGKFGGGGQNMRVEVVGRISGQDIVLSSNNYLASQNKRFFN